MTIKLKLLHDLFLGEIQTRNTSSNKTEQGNCNGWNSEQAECNKGQKQLALFVTKESCLRCNGKRGDINGNFACGGLSRGREVQKEHGNSRLTTADIEGRINITWKEKLNLCCTAAGTPTQRSAQGIFMQNGSVNRMSNSC